MSNLVDISEPAPHVRQVTLSDEPRRNALSSAMMEAIATTVEDLDADPDVHVVVLTGAGSAFCSGGDLDSFDANPDAARTRDHMRRGIQRLPRVFNFIDTPIVAMINGPAIGAGLDLALACDIRIASEKASFSAAFIKMGLVAADGGAYLLPRLVGPERALELLLTARRIDSTEALEIGMVSRVVGADDLVATTIELASQIAAQSPVAASLIKRLVREAAHQSMSDSLEAAAAYAGLSAMTSEHHDAVVAAQARQKS